MCVFKKAFNASVVHEVWLALFAACLPAITGRMTPDEMVNLVHTLAPYARSVFAKADWASRIGLELASVDEEGDLDVRAMVAHIQPHIGRLAEKTKPIERAIAAVLIALGDDPRVAELINGPLADLSFNMSEVPKVVAVAEVIGHSLQQLALNIGPGKFTRRLGFFMSLVEFVETCDQQGLARQVLEKARAYRRYDARGKCSHTEADTAAEEFAKALIGEARALALIRSVNGEPAVTVAA